MPKKKKVLYPVFFMVAVTVFFTVILSGINELSIRTIEKQEKLKIQTKVLNSLGVDYGRDDDKIIQIYGEIIEEKELNGMKYYEARTGGIVDGYAFTVEGAGLWGRIEGILALDSELSSIMGIEFISHSETPGLGGRIEEIWFLEQFRHIPIEYEEGEHTLVFKPSLGGNVDAISGATITSKAVLKILNESIDEILKMKEDVI